MAKFTKSDLKYSYSWKADGGDNPRLRGKPDNSLLDRTEGYEVLYMINNVLNDYTFKDDKAAGNAMELIIKNLPPRSHTQDEVYKLLNSRVSVKS